MSDAKKCDRCGKLCEGFPSVSDCSLFDDWWRYSLIRDNHPYPEEKLDLCVNCKRSLAKWFKEEQR